VIQDWKQQDEVRQALSEAGGDFGQAAERLHISPAALQRKVKKWGLFTGGVERDREEAPAGATERAR
jgi:hypothetical protein